MHVPACQRAADALQQHTTLSRAARMRYALLCVHLSPCGWPAHLVFWQVIALVFWQVIALNMGVSANHHHYLVM